MMSSRDHRELLEKFDALDERGRQMLLEFAEFLGRRHPASGSSAAAEPAAIARPASESVIEAMRRLSRTYPMLDADELLHRASDLMSQHVLGARPAREIVDELEALFSRHYESWRDAGADTGERED